MPGRPWLAGADGVTVLLLVSCGSSGTEPHDEPLPVANIQVTSPATSIIEGTSIQLTAEALDAHGQKVPGSAITWSTTNQSILSVSSSGLATGIKAGAASAKATSGGVTGSVAITVLRRVASLKVTPELDTLYPGMQLQLHVDVRDGRGDVVADAPVVWSSQTNTVATVSTEGLVNTVAPGVVTISATVGDLVASMTLLVLREPVNSISMEPTELTTVVGSLIHFNVRLFGASGNELHEPIPDYESSPPASLLQNGYLPTALVLGDATYTARADEAETSSLVHVVQITHVTVDAGGTESCSLDATGLAFCWGEGPGQIYLDYLPSNVPGYPVFDSVRAGTTFSCGLAAGAVSCWGQDPVTASQHAEPHAVSGATGYVDIDVGDGFACGLAGDGSAHCWGDNGLGQLGDGTTGASQSPTTVAGSHVFQALRAGATHACGLESDGQVYCWGGQSGSLTPRLVSDTVTFAHITGGICGLDGIGAAWCWNDAQPLPAPVKVSGYTFASLDSRGGHVCGLQTDGSAWCWGDNTYGQLGDLTSDPSATPVAVTGGLTYRMLTVGSRHACGIATDNRVYCWGSSTAAGVGPGASLRAPVPMLGQP
jgi:hypothetical protein